MNNLRLNLQLNASDFIAGLLKVFFDFLRFFKIVTRTSQIRGNFKIAKIENKLASFFRTSMSLEWAAKKIELEKSVLFETIFNGLQPVGISNAN